MTKMETYTAIGNESREASFLANVILVQHSNPARKLRGVWTLLQTGHEVRTAQYAIDVLLVDGEPRQWAWLETVA